MILTYCGKKLKITDFTTVLRKNNNLNELRFVFMFTCTYASLPFVAHLKSKYFKPGGLDLSRRDLDRDLDLDTEKKLVSTVEKTSTVSKS